MLKILSWLRIRSKVIIVFLAIVIAISYFYFLYKQNSYEHRALKYMKEFDPKQNYKYLRKSDEDCEMLVGCKIEVYLEGKVTGEKVTVLFLNGRLAPFATAKTIK